MDMINVLKKTLQNGMEIIKYKELSNKYKITLGYKNMESSCELQKTCAPGKEIDVCKKTIDTAVSSMYINVGNFNEAQLWLHGEYWNDIAKQADSIIGGCDCCQSDEALYWADDENNVFVDSKGDMMVTIKGMTMRYKVKCCPNCGKKF